MNKWKLAIGTAYLKRTPGERDPAFLFYEPIESSIIFNVGLSRAITKASNLSLEIINASHDVVIDNSDREDLSSEALLSLHTKFKNTVLTLGGGFGLTDGIAVPAARAFLGVQYTFGPRAKKAEKPIEEPVYIEEETDFDIEDSVIPPAPSENQKFILNNIEFKFDSYELNQGSRATLDEVYNYLQTNNYNTIEIWGHTDFVGTLEYNEYLGLSRAQAVFKYLRSKGIPESSMKYDSFGERRPVNTGLANDLRRKNRRVEIILIK